MLSLFDNLRDITIASIFLRLVLAVVCGGIIGMEREFKRRPAGFRTHILICLGAALATMTSQFLFMNMHYYLDMARMGAGVVSGIGFMGAGTIIVTRHQRVRGLTTAAGLWVAAIAGLALGAGFYEGGIFTTVLTLMAELLFSRLEYRMLKNAAEFSLYAEYIDKACIEELLRLFREADMKIVDMGIIHPDGSELNACAIFTLRLHKGTHQETLVDQARAIPGMVSVRKL